MPIAFLGGFSVNWANAGLSTYSQSFTLPPGTDFVAFFAASDRGTMSLISATVGGNAMAPIAAQMLNAQTEVNTRGFCRAGAIAGAQSCAVTFGAATSNNPCLVVGCWSGVDQTSPIYNGANFDASSLGNVTSIAPSLAVSAGDVGVCMVQQGFPRSENPNLVSSGGSTIDFHGDHTGVIRSLGIFSKPGPISALAATQAPTSRAECVVFSLLAAGGGGGGILLPQVERGRTINRGIGRGV